MNEKEILLRAIQDYLRQTVHRALTPTEWDSLDSTLDDITEALDGQDWTTLRSAAARLGGSRAFRSLTDPEAVSAPERYRRRVDETVKEITRASAGMKEPGKRDR